MQLDEEDLRLLVEISNYERVLTEPMGRIYDGLPLRRVMCRRAELTEELTTMRRRFVQRALVVAGLALPPDDASLAVASKTDHSSRLAPPDPVLMSECEAKRIADNMRTTPGNVRVLFATSPRPAPESPSVRQVEIPEVQK